MQITTPSDVLHTRATVGISAEPLLNPFTILYDSAETQLYTFQGFHADADRKGRALAVIQGVNLIRECLGRHPHSLGDYSMAGAKGRCHVERKSMDDAHGTILGWSADNKSNDINRRDRFEQELANLSNIEAAHVVVECSWREFLDRAPEYDQGRKTAECNRKILNRSVISWKQQYGVGWQFCDSRRDAEEFTFDFLRMFYKHHRKEIEKELGK
jgi:hypothetical protein